MFSTELFDIFMICLFLNGAELLALGTKQESSKWEKANSYWSHVYVKTWLYFILSHFHVQDICNHNLNNAVHKYYSWVFCVCISHQQNETTIFRVTTLFLLSFWIQTLRYPRAFKKSRPQGKFPSKLPVPDTWHNGNVPVRFRESGFYLGCLRLGWACE